MLLVGLAIMALPMAAAALGLDLEAKGGVGFALGSTDNKDVTGVARVAGQGGIAADLYLVTLGPVDIGLSTGAEYAYLTTHSTWKGYSLFPSPIPPGTASDQTTDTRYSYLIIPVSIVARYPLSSSVTLIGRLGAFYGYFLSGQIDVSWDPEIPLFQIVDSKNNKATSDDVKSAEYGIHATAGADIGIMPNVSLSPSVQLDMGLTDTTPNNATNGSFNDTLWSLTLMVGIKYKAL